jgi:hypothetical protein
MILPIIVIKNLGINRKIGYLKTIQMILEIIITKNLEIDQEEVEK